MNFAIIDDAIQLCDLHVSQLDAAAPQTDRIKSFLVGYLLVLIYGRFETRIKAMVKLRIERTNDQHLLSFLREASKKATGRMEISELCNTLARFGPDYKQAFSTEIIDKAPHVAWDTIIRNRNELGHGGTIQVTLEELTTTYPRSLPVLDAFADALHLTLQECKTL